MRVAVILALLVVFAVFVQSKDHDEKKHGKHHGKHRSKAHEERKKQKEEHYKEHEKSHHERMKFGHFKHLKHKLTRAGGNATIATNGSYIKDYPINANTTVTIVYNSTEDYIGVYNPKKQLASVYASNQTIVEIYNITSQCVLTVDTRTHQAGLIQNITIDFKNRKVIEKSFSQLYDLIITNNPGKNSTASFDFNVLLNAFLSGNFSAIFQQSGQIQRNALDAFFGFFNDVATAFRNGIHSIGGLFAPFFGIYGNIALFVAEAFTSIIQSGAKITWPYVRQFFLGLGSSYEFFRVNFIKALTAAVKSAGQLYENFAAAVQAFASGNAFRNITSQIVNYSGNNVSVVGGVTRENDWLINILDQNGAVNATVNFNTTGNIFGFYNASLHTATVFTGDRLFAICNTTTGAVLVVNQLSGNARFVPANATVAAAFRGKVNVAFGFTLIANVIIAHCDNLDFPINFDQDVFSFRVLVFALHTGLDPGTAFIGKGSLQVAVFAQYGVLFADARASFAKDPFSLIWGVIGVLSPLFGLPGAAAKMFFQYFGGFVNGTLSAIQAGAGFFNFFGNITQNLGRLLPPTSGNVGFHFAWGNITRTTSSS